MGLKRSLRMAVSVLAAAALGLGGCATSGVGSASAPKASEAQSFVADAEAELMERYLYDAHVAWVFQNFITYDTEQLAQRADAESTELSVRLANAAARYQGLDLDPVLARQLDMLRLGLTLPAPTTEGAANELAEITTRLASTYSSGKIDFRGEATPLNELEVHMRELRDPGELQEIWTGWREVSKPMAGDYARMVEIANEGARELGFADVGEMWLSKYDMPPEDMAAEVERLWGQVAPLYEQLHCHVRASLNANYGDAIVPLDQPIRADLLGNMWAQSWGSLYDVAAPTDSERGFDLTELLRENEYDAIQMVRVGERFYTSLGLAPLPDTFWERSLFVRPEDRDVVCHASAWNLDTQDDLRIKMCISIEAEDFRTVHHELGHNYYQRAYNAQPFLFRDDPNDGFHEAIGDFAALNVTPEYLVQIGLLAEDQVPDASGDVGLLMGQALDKVAFLPFGYLMDQWRWKVFSGEVTPAEYNDAWWELRTQIQGVRPPAERPADAFDPGAKYHIANNVPYLRYFLAYMLQFQFYQSACAQAGWEGPLHRCTVYGNEEVGARFNAMMEMGASQPWPDALEAFTGTREIDGSALVAYFQPLQEWLEVENAGRTCGW